MKKAELLKLARQYFISDAGLSTANLIRKIQLAEGHVDCYATGKTECDQMGCRWRRSCLNEANQPDAGELPAEIVDRPEEIKS